MSRNLIANNLKKLLLSMFYCFLFSPLIYSQTVISGSLYEKNTESKLMYANIQCGNENTTSDVHGNFKMEYEGNGDSLYISYVGYNRKSVWIDGEQELINLGNIFLEASDQQINTVTITSGKYRKEIQEVTVSMEIIKPDLIESTHSTNFADILNMIPGVQNLDDQVNIRGGAGYSYGAGSRVMLLLDNLPALQNDAAFPNWGDLPIENIAQVEVLKGAGSALYGSAAMNGVINILTRYATKKTHFDIQGQYTSYLSPSDSLKKWWDKSPYKYNISSSFSKKIGDLSIVSSAFFVDGSSFYKDSYNRYGRFHLKLDYPVRENILVGIAGNFNKGESRSFFYWKNEGSGAYLSDSLNYSNAGKFRFTVDPYITIYSKNQLTNRLNTRIHRVRNSSDNDQSTFSDSYYAEYQMQKTWSRIALILTSGMVGRYSNVDAPLYGDSLFVSENYAIYTQLEKKFGEKFNINVGARIESNDIDGPKKIDGKDIPDEGFETRPVFRAGMNYEIIPYSNIRASWGQGYRYPSIAEKYISTRAGTLQIIPNPDLESEFGWTAELGYRQGIKLGNLKGFADLSVFRSEYNNMMEFNILIGTISFAAQNIGNTVINGVELSTGLQGDLGNIHTVVQGGYTYINPQYKSFNDTIKTLSSSDENVLKYRSRHNLKFDLNISYKKISFVVGSNYLSHMEAVDAAFEVFIPGVKKFRENHLEGMQVWYSSLSFKLNNHWQLSARVDNLFNEEYVLRPAKLEAPRNISLRVKYNL